jgi:flagellar biosynthetic protein FliP
MTFFEHRLPKAAAAAAVAAVTAFSSGMFGTCAYAAESAVTEVTTVSEYTVSFTSMTPMETIIPNVSTEVPQEEQTTAATTEYEHTDETIPYDEPVTDDDSDDSESLLEALDINNSTTTLDLVILITILSLAPSILIMTTCFTRIIISFSLLRNAMGVQQTPPNQVMIGLALFLTFFIMSPVLDEMNEAAYVPYKNGEMTSVEAVQAASVPLKEWMLKNTSNDTMAFFINLSDEDYSSVDDAEFVEKIPFRLVAPAFMLSEIKIGFQIGFLLYIPFLVIDMVVSSVLMSMGMMMLPPSTVSMPFKILMFVLVDGWQLLAGSLVSGFNV